MIVIHLVITGETAPVAKLDDNNDDNEMIEALFVASLMNEKMNGEDNAEWRRFFRRATRFYRKHKRVIHRAARFIFGKKK
jgi:hypothetical protein